MPTGTLPATADLRERCPGWPRVRNRTWFKAGRRPRARPRKERCPETPVDGGGRDLRNGLLVRAADAVVAVGCSWGTLSEIALARRTGVPLVLIDPWDLPADVGTVVVGASEAVDAVIVQVQ